MFIVESYALAVFFCVITMLCWGSWGNAQKLAGKTWRYEFFYWDYVIGIVLLGLIAGLTLGSIGTQGRHFLADLGQADGANVLSALLGGAIFNAGNILLAAAVSIAGMSVAFPVGVGLALILGVVINYVATPKGNPAMLFAGVALIAAAIVMNATAYKLKDADAKKTPVRGILLAAIGGFLMAFFFRFTAAAMDLSNFAAPAAGKMTPYSAFFVFAIGIFLSNFVFNYIAMKHPAKGEPVDGKLYFAGSLPTHCVGLLGGLVWGTGNVLSLIAADKAGAAISYGLGQGATLIAALWGILIWREFRGAPKIAHLLNAAMFLVFLAGLVLLIVAGQQ
ncbi:MAG: GRP family sugar transporter [Victivallaceae bacterium]|nr:GRP family sugar transporter [Victivallaceae bacterium]